jgi:hypothetical protein
VTASDLQVPGWPLVVIELSPENTQVDGNAIEVPPGADARSTAFAHAVGQATRIRRPVRVKIIDSDGAEHLVAAHPDGTETVLEAPSTQRGRKKTKPPKPAKAPKTPKAPKASKAPEGRSGGGTTRAKLAARNSAPAVEGSPTPVAIGPGAGLKAALDAEDWVAAATALKRLKAQGGQEDRVAELEGQLAGLRGDDAGAARQYTVLALARHGALGPDHPDTERAADLAQEAWRRVADPGEAKKIGAALLALRDLVPGGGGQRSAQVRAGLARLHVQTAPES